MGNDIQKHDSSFLQILSQPILLAPSQQINASDNQQIIYHNKNVSTQYFIRFLQQFSQSHRIQTHQQFLNNLMATRHHHIVPLFYFQLTSCIIPSIPSQVSKVVCNKHPMLQSYYLFYNFSLRQLINRGFVSLKTPRFRQDELWYIAYSLIQIINGLSKFNVSTGGITTKDIMLTPHGQIQYYPNKLRIDNSHAVFFDLIKNPRAVLQAYLPPDQLTSVRKGNYILPNLLSTLKSGDIFCIGMILLQCVTFQCSEKYYSLITREINMGTIKSRLRSLKQTRIISQGLIEFISRCLQQQQSMRITLKQAQQIIQIHSKSRSLTFIAQQSFESNALTTLKSSELSTLSHTTQSLKLRNR